MVATLSDMHRTILSVAGEFLERFTVIELVADSVLAAYPAYTKKDREVSSLEHFCSKLASKGLLVSDVLSQIERAAADPAVSAARKTALDVER